MMRKVGWVMGGILAGALLPYVFLLCLSYGSEKTTSSINRLLDRVWGPAMGYEHALLLMVIGASAGCVVGILFALRTRE